MLSSPAALVVESGDLWRLVHAVIKASPGQNTNGFVQPAPEEIERFVAAVRAAKTGSFEESAGLLDSLNYELLEFEDEPRGRSHLVFRERVPHQRCWGLLLVSQSPSRPEVAIEAPHPLGDRRTGELAIEAYTRLEAGLFLMAGAHRWANGPDSLVSDMARNESSVFQGLHVALTEPEALVLQYHGFSLDKNPGYPNVVLSNGSDEPEPELYAFAAALEMLGESAGVYDGESWAGLRGTANPQGRHTRSIGGLYWQLEHELSLRLDPVRRTTVVEAALEALFP